MTEIALRIARRFLLLVLITTPFFILTRAAYPAGKGEDIFEFAMVTQDFRENLYVYLKNPTKKPLEIEEIYIDGKSVKELAAHGQEVRFDVQKKGVVRWYDVLPQACTTRTMGGAQNTVWCQGRGWPKGAG